MGIWLLISARINTFTKTKEKPWALFNLIGEAWQAVIVVTVGSGRGTDVITEKVMRSKRMRKQNLRLCLGNEKEVTGKKKKKVALQHYSWFWANQFFRTLLNSCSMPALVSRGPRSVTSVIPTLRDFMDSSPPGSSVHGIFLARILEWVTMPSSEIFPTQGSNLCLLHCRQILYHWAFQEASLGDHQAHNNIDIGRWSGIRSDRNVEISRSKVVGG